MLEIFIFLQKYINLECKTQHAVNTHANTSNGIKISTFFGKKLGMMLYLSSAHLKSRCRVNRGKNAHGVITPA